MHVYFLKIFEYFTGFSVFYMANRGEGIIVTQQNKNGIPFMKNMSSVINTSL